MTLRKQQVYSINLLILFILIYKALLNITILLNIRFIVYDLNLNIQFQNIGNKMQNNTLSISVHLHNNVLKELI